MEDAAEALKIAMTIFVFITALSVAFAVISQARATADIVFEYQDDSRYMQEGLEGITYLSAGETERIVGWETVIPTIYRYFEEEYGVTIIDTNQSNGSEIIARFDLITESVARKWYDTSEDAKNERSNHISYLNNKVLNVNYDENKWTEIFERIYKAEGGEHTIDAPWLTSVIEDRIERLNVDLSNTEGQITSRTSTKHSGLGLGNKYRNKKFRERIHIITETKENGEVSEKVEITYTLIEP